MIHKKTIEYPGGLEKLAEDLGDLHYESLEDFLKLFSKKIFKDALADNKRNRPQLSIALHSAAVSLEESSSAIGEAWKISEPYMK